MNPEIVWTIGAQSDLQAVHAKLEDWSIDSGDRFVYAIDGALMLLSMFPESAPIYDFPFRRLLIKDSNYGVFYTAENRGIIHMVIDLRSDPASIIRRLKGD